MEPGFALFFPNFLAVSHNMPTSGNILVCVFITGGGMYHLTRVNEGLSPSAWSLPLPAAAGQWVRHEHQEDRTRKAAALQPV